MSEYLSDTVGDPTLALDGITRVPSVGTGLEGSVYVAGEDESIWSITALKALIFDTSTPDYTFTASQVAYGGNTSETTVADFLGADAGSLNGDGSADEIGPGGVQLSGYIFIPEGEHTISVHSDDGYELSIGGELFSAHEYGRGSESTSNTVYFEGGLYEIDLLYFDGAGASELYLSVDGFVVDQSALYGSVEDFQNPPADVGTIAVDRYHPSMTHGEEAIRDSEDITGTDGRDIIDALGGHDKVDGGAGDDEIYGGYGDDHLMGGDGEDVLDGGRGSDLLEGGAGNDLLISRSDTGEQRIGQLAIGDPTRPDPDNEVNNNRQKLKGWEDQPVVGDDIMVGGTGADTFLFTSLLNAKLEIIEKHTRADGSINWAGVAGENDELHDHWTDNAGIDVIADFNKAEGDHIAVIGHTANIFISYEDVDGDGDEESIIDVISIQHGNGGAHDRDLINQIIVHGDRVEEEDVSTDNGVTFGIVEGIEDAYEAIEPGGRTKKFVDENGETVYGYDTRSPMMHGGEDGHAGSVADAMNAGPVTGNPWDHVDNPYMDQVSFADPSGEQYEPTRFHLDQLGFEEVQGSVIEGTEGDDILTQEVPSQGGMPGALAFWQITGPGDGVYEDAKGGMDLRTYTIWENQALLREGGLTKGPFGDNKTALTFNGEDQFAFVNNDDRYQVTQGTIALWIKPQDLEDDSVFLSKDARNTGDGGHFHLGHTDDGDLLLRFAPGDGDANTSWTADVGLSHNDWTHIAVNFTENGIKVFVDGQAVPDNAWTPVEGNVATPGDQTKAYMLQNDEPWVLGASTARADFNGTAQIFATDDDKLVDPFEGAIAEFGLWGGTEPGDALSAREIETLYTDGVPDRALNRDAGPQPIEAADDVINGGAGDDMIDGMAGDDELRGGGGNDTIYGGYGDDEIYGGSGADTLDGGFGSDIVYGGAGNDLIISKSDVGEDRAGQLVLGEPTRDLGGSINEDTLKLWDWDDQALVGDDILFGGDGQDHFYFELGINAKLDILQRHVNDDRSINWHGVAGENREIHDHWVDGIGVDIIGDYNAEEDQISVIGHTVNVEVSYHGVDMDEDGVEDDVVSVITAYSQQGNGGGAHDEDYLGYIVVFGDLVDEEDVITDAGAHYGVVDTIDEAQTAVAPEGEKHASAYDGEVINGYDTRDIEGDPMGNAPIAFSQNDHLQDVMDEFESNAPSNAGSATVVMSDAGGRFGGPGTTREIAHTAPVAQQQGSWAFTFNADSPGGSNQTLISKDHVGYKGGGHLDMYLDGGGRLVVRFQSYNESRYIRFEERIEAGEDYHVTFTFDEDEINLFVNGELAGTEAGFEDGMLGNLEDTVIGASTAQRDGNDDNLEEFFYGTITDIEVYDRPLDRAETILLASQDGEAVTPGGALGEALPDDDGGQDGGSGGGAGGGDEGQGDGGGSDDTPADGLELFAGTNEDDKIKADLGADRVVGMDGDDKLSGFFGADVIEGGAGDDILIGGRGTAGDTLDGGDGSDLLLGGKGMDRFVFSSADYTGVDTVGDFQTDLDVVVVSAEAFGIEGPLADAVSVKGEEVTADTRLIYREGSGKLYYDADGSGDGADRKLLAEFGEGTELTDQHFELL